MTGNETYKYLKSNKIFEGAEIIVIERRKEIQVAVSNTKDVLLSVRTLQGLGFNVAANYGVKNWRQTAADNDVERVDFSHLTNEEKEANFRAAHPFTLGGR